MIDANTEIAVILTAGEWNAVLDALADRPYRLVSQVIQKIYAECQKAEGEEAQ